MPKGVYVRVKRVFPDILEVVAYDPSSPSFLRWKDSEHVIERARGRPAGYLSCEGRYWSVAYGRNWVRVNRLIWVMFNGPIPDGMIVDHINGNRYDNSIANLRLTTQKINTRNAAKRKDNTSGHHGIHRGSYAWIVQWCDPETGKRRAKQFNLSKIGSEQLALNAAIAFRDSLHVQLATIADYSHRHGTPDDGARLKPQYKEAA